MVSIIDRIKKIFKPKPKSDQLGSVITTPSESAKYGKEIQSKTGQAPTVVTGSFQSPRRLSGGGGGGSSASGSGGGGEILPQGDIQEKIDPVGFAQQKKLSAEVTEKIGSTKDPNVKRTYDQFLGDENQRYIRVTESSREGMPINRRIYSVTPKGDYVLISQSQANVTGLQQSQLQQTSVKDIIRLGDKEIVFESIQNLYKTKEGKLATAYGTFDITEDAVIQQEQEARSKAAEQFINEKGFSPVISEKSKDKSIFSKAFKELKVLYTASPFGITSPVEVEGEQERKFLSISGSGGGGGIFIPKFNFASLDIGTARDLVEREESDRYVAKQQVTAIENLGKVIEGTPLELQYDVQQKGLSRLRTIGVDYSVDETTGDLIFTSKAGIPKKSFAGLELEKADTFPEKAGVGATIIGIKALEFYLGGEAIEVLGRGAKAGYQFARGGLGLPTGVRLTEVAFEGRGAVATAEFVEQSAARGVLGKAGRVAGYTGVGGLIVAGKVSQYGAYADIYGKEIGRELFVLETIGEVAGIGGSIGGGIIRNRQIAPINEGIVTRNIERDLQLQRLEDVKGFGQFSKQARVTFTEVGTGRSVLTKGDREILQGVFVRDTGLTRKEAEQLINEGAIFEQNLIVESPAGFEPFVFSRLGILRSKKVGTGFEELALEFTRRGRRVTNLGIKATTGEGEYAITSIFERTRKSRSLREILQFGEFKFIKETAPQDQLKLKEVLVSKVRKQKRVELDGVTFSVAKIESRLLKSFPKGKDRYNVEEVLRSGLPKNVYSESYLKELFEEAGVGARISTKPQRIVRVEEALFRKEGILRVQRDGEFKFLQTGRSGKRLPLSYTQANPSLRNLLKDLDFAKQFDAFGTRRARRTPLSTTFGAEVTQDQNLVKQVEKQLRSGSQKAITKQRQRTTQFSIAPTIESGFKIKAKARNFEELKVAEDVLLRSGVSIKDAVRELLGVRSQSKTKQKDLVREKVAVAVRERTLQQEIQIQQQRQRQNQSARLRQPQVNIPALELLPSLKSPPTRIRTPFPRIAAFSFEKEKRKQKILNLKKLLQEDELAFFPTFSAKALDIPAIEVSSEKEALRLIKQIRTGFEVTGGVRITK